MIQRIQTLYLTLALLMMGFLIALPMGEIAVDGKIYSFSVNGIVDSLTGQTVNSAWYLILFLVVIILLQILIIFFYKKRVWQMKIAILNIFLMLGFLLVGWIFLTSSAKSLGNGVSSFNMAFVFPIISMILNYLAFTHIRRDENLVKSIDRIR